MKIVHLNANSAGGAFVAANRLSAALNETGKVESKHLVFSGQEGAGYTLWANSFFRKKKAFYLHAREKMEFLAHEKERALRFAFSHGSTGIRVDKLPEVLEADVVHLHWINKGFISLDGLEALYSSGKKIIWTAHDLWPFTGGCYHPRSCNHYEVVCGNCMYLKNPSGNDLSAKVFSQKLKLYEKYNPMIVVPGKWSAAMAGKSGLSEHIRLREIGHFIDTELFSPGVTLANGKFRILFSSMNLLNPKKGIFDLEEAIRLLPQDYIERIELMLVGHSKEALPGFSCRINQVGVVESQIALAELYRQNDLMIVPSYEETFGLTAAEAQSCGLPVLAYASGELAYNIYHNETGWLCETGNVSALTSALKAAMELQSQVLHQFGEHARTFALQKFAKKTVVEAYLDCYAEI